MLNRRTFRTALLTAAMAMLMGVVSVPASADDSKTLKNDELKNLIANAKDAQDHQRIADHYTAKAAQFESEATEHAEEAAKYRANPNMHEMKHPGGQTLPATASQWHGIFARPPRTPENSLRITRQWRRPQSKAFSIRELATKP